MNHVSTSPLGAGILHDPQRNRGSAFTLEERRALGIEGLLPPVPDSLETQVARVNRQLEMLDTDLQKYLFLSDLQARNETLYLRGADVRPGDVHAAGLHADGRRSLPEIRPRLSRRAAASICRSRAKGRVERTSRQLAAEGRALHRRDRWRAHPRAWAIWASAAWASRSASSRSTPPAPACRRS